MKITDNQGEEITITNLGASIIMVSEFLKYMHLSKHPSVQRMEKQRIAYWQDIYDKLLQLKETF
jgi:hypothetical protein